MPTDRQKIEMYEALLHNLQMASSVTMDSSRVSKLLDNICSWSYAHRMGNGELSDNQVASLVEQRFWKLLD